MEHQSAGKLFPCVKCRRKSMLIYRWRQLNPVGICCECGTTTELTEEDIMLIQRRVCDRPGCTNDIEDGTGAVVFASLFVPITDAEGNELSVDRTPDDDDVEVKDLQVCDECAAIYRQIFTDEAVIKKIFGNRKRSISNMKTRAAKKGEDTQTLPPEGTPPASLVLTAEGGQEGGDPDDVDKWNVAMEDQGE